MHDGPLLVGGGRRRDLREGQTLSPETEMLAVGDVPVTAVAFSRTKRSRPVKILRCGRLAVTAVNGAAAVQPVLPSAEVSSVTVMLGEVPPTLAAVSARRKTPWSPSSCVEPASTPVAVTVTALASVT